MVDRDPKLRLAPEPKFVTTICTVSQAGLLGEGWWRWWYQLRLLLITSNKEPELWLQINRSWFFSPNESLELGSCWCSVNSSGRGTVSLPFLHAHRLLVTRRPYTSRYYICIWGRKMERRKVGASTSSREENVFQDQPLPNKSRLLRSHGWEGGHMPTPPAGKKAEERKNLSLFFLHGKDKNGFMQLLHS